MCSRKQKRIFQTLLLLTVVFGFLYGAMLYYELQTQLRKAEAVALKYQQHQESLSAQLQGTANGTRAAPGQLRPAHPSRVEKWLWASLSHAGATADLQGRGRRATQGCWPSGASGELAFPSSRRHPAVAFGIGDTCPSSR